MKYYIMNPVLSSSSEFCKTDEVPDGVRHLSFMMAKGQRMGEKYIEDAKMYMREDAPGIVLSDLISNTDSILPVSRRMKEIIEEMAECEIEYLPFILINHRGRVASNDYFIINVIGALDCLNYEASVIKWFREMHGRVISVKKYVLDAEKVETAPHIFRVKETPGKYVISEKLAHAFEAAGLTNINLKELEVV